MPRVTLSSRLPAIAASLRPRVSAAVKAAAEEIAEDARQRVAVGPPPTHIKDHIEVVRKEAAGYYVMATATDEKGIPYAHMHEFGTVSHPPFPFLIPAAEAGQSTAESLVAASLRGL